jgi:hypothetical protein
MFTAAWGKRAFRNGAAVVGTTAPSLPMLRSLGAERY